MNFFTKGNNELATMYLIYESPVLQETPDLMGISHLLEHMMCCSMDDLNEELDQHGLTLNAFTSTHEVVYHLSGLDEELAKYRDTFLARIQGYVPNKVDFEKELNIVRQEYLDYYGSPDQASYMNLLSGKYGFVGAIGSWEALENITFEKVVEFHKKAFAKPTKFLYVGPREYSPELSFGEVQAPSKEKFRNINKDAGFNPNSIPLMILGEPINGDDLYLTRIISSMLSFGLASPLMKELREKRSLCYGASASTLDIEEGFVPALVTSVKESNLEEAKEVMMEILSNPDKYMTRKRFELVMENIRISIKAEDQTPTSGALRKILRSGQKKFSVKQNLDSITYEKVMDFYKKVYDPAHVKFEVYSQKEIDLL